MGEVPPENPGDNFHSREVFSTAWADGMQWGADIRAGQGLAGPLLTTGMWFLGRLAFCIWGEQLGGQLREEPWCPARLPVAAACLPWHWQPRCLCISSGTVALAASATLPCGWQEALDTSPTGRFCTPSSIQPHLLQLPDSEERCYCRALGCAHPLLESSLLGGQAAGGSHLGCGGITASGLCVALVDHQAFWHVP